MKRYLLFAFVIWLLAASTAAIASDGADGTFNPLERAGYLLTNLLQHKTKAEGDVNLDGEDVKELDSIIALYDEAIRQHPDDVTAYSQRAFAFSLMQNYEKAIEDYSIAINLQPSAADLYKNRAINYERMGNLEAALRDYERFASLIAYAPTERRERERTWVSEKIQQIISQTGLERTPNSELPKLTPPPGFIPKDVPAPKLQAPPPSVLPNNMEGENPQNTYKQGLDVLKKGQ